MIRVSKGLKELRLCTKLLTELDFRKPDYDLLDVIKEEAAKMGLPSSARFAAVILGRVKKRRLATELQNPLEDTDYNHRVG